MSEENTTTNNSTDASATKTVIEVPLEKKKSISASSLVANAKKQNASPFWDRRNGWRRVICF